MKKSLLVLIALTCSIYQYSLSNQQIIILNGTTTAGKSSIAQELQKKLGDKTVILSHDTYFISTLQNPLNWTCSMWCNVPRGLCGDGKWITSKELNILALKALSELLYTALEYYSKGFTVILDVVAYKKDVISLINASVQDHKSKWVLVYCPLETLIERVIERNKQKDATQHRSLTQALNQFTHFYSAKDPKGEGKIIDTLSLETLEATLAKAQSTRKTSPKPPKYIQGIQHAICPYTFDEIQNNVHKTFPVSENQQSFSIAASIQHNLLLDTYENTSEECADRICREIKKKQS